MKYEKFVVCFALHNQTCILLHCADFQVPLRLSPFRICARIPNSLGLSLGFALYYRPANSAAVVPASHIRYAFKHMQAQREKLKTPPYQHSDSIIGNGLAINFHILMHSHRPLDSLFVNNDGILYNTYFSPHIY